jgi:hypothetical protein
MLHSPALTHHSWLVAAGAALGFVLNRFVGLDRVGASLMAIAAATAAANVAPVAVGAQAAGGPV